MDFVAACNARDLAAIRDTSLVWYTVPHRAGVVAAIAVACGLEPASS